MKKEVELIEDYNKWITKTKAIITISLFIRASSPIPKFYRKNNTPSERLW